MEKEAREKLDRALSPRVVAVVGAKKDSNYSWLVNNKNFTGKLYSVQIDPNEIPGILEMGIENYPSLMDIPDEIDYVICAVPRNVSPYIVADCVKKGVGGVTLFTSGFAETGTEDGRQFQERITQMAREGNLNLVGPNCMGIYNPRVGLKFNAEQPHTEDAFGGVAFASQSGSQGGGFSTEAYHHGIGVSKVVSFGNGVVLDGTDYLEFFADDPETQVIAMYLEGLREGRRFFETLRKVAAKKPVVIWKGGVTEESSRAANSHTASLAISSSIWDALLRQCGAMNVHGLDETIDAVKALMFSRPIKSYPRLGLIAVAGGHSVEISDCFSLQGCKVPRLSSESYEQLSSFYSVVGGSFQNPIEGGGNWAKEENVTTILNILDNDPNVDAIVMELGTAGVQRSHEGLMQRIQTLKDFFASSKKPFWAVQAGGTQRVPTELAREVSHELQQGGIPIFPNFVRAAAAMKRLVEYNMNRE